MILLHGSASILPYISLAVVVLAIIALVVYVTFPFLINGRRKQNLTGDKLNRLFKKDE